MFYFFRLGVILKALLKDGFIDFFSFLYFNPLYLKTEPQLFNLHNKIICLEVTNKNYG